MIAAINLNKILNLIGNKVTQKVKVGNEINSKMQGAWKNMIRLLT